MNKNIRNIVSVTVLVGLIVFWWTNRVSIPTGEIDKPVNKILQNDWSKGNKEASIKVIEYSDIQCPACQIYKDVSDQLISVFGDKVEVAYRHFPLKELHKNSVLAAKAAEAAGKQGKFFELTKLMFDKQEEWSDQSDAEKYFKDYAKQVGLDINSFEQEIKSKSVEALVEADYLSGLTAKINSTPTFFVNGQKVNNLKGPEDLIARIELYLQESSKSAIPKQVQ